MGKNIHQRQIIQLSQKFNKEIIAIINSYVKSEFKISVKFDHKDFVRDILDKILIEGDKNVGYVCMYIQDLLDQYDKINFQQRSI